MATPAKDKLITLLLQDPSYDVRNDGTIWTCIKAGRLGLAYGVWHQTGTVKSGSGQYYTLTYHRKVLIVHRIIYAKFHGPLKADLEIDHRDRNKWNNRPENLQQVTRKVNGRRTRNVTLTDDIVKSIRTAIASGEPQYVVAKRYGISKQQASRIHRKQRWA